MVVSSSVRAIMNRENFPKPSAASPDSATPSFRSRPREPAPSRAYARRPSSGERHAKAEVVSIKARRTSSAAGGATGSACPASAPAGVFAQEAHRREPRWLSIINAHKLNDYKRRKIVSETIDNFRYYYNRGFLEYRKAVTESGEYAAIEWSGKGSHFEDVTGRRFIDCLGGYGIYSAGINHPKIVRAVKSQLDRMPLSSQELLDPLRERSRGCWGSWPGEPPGLLLHLQRHRRRRRGHEAGPPLHRQARLHLLHPRLPWQELRVAVAHGQGRVTGWPSSAAQGRLFRAFGDAQAVENELRKAEAVGMAIAGVVVEPIQGEAGAISAPAGFLAPRA